MAMRSSPDPTAVSDRSSEGLLPELVEHLRQNRTGLREEWARRITDARLLTAMTPEEIFSEATSVYDNYVEVLETGSIEDAAGRTRATCLNESFPGASRPTRSSASCYCCGTCWPARSFEKYQKDCDLLNRSSRRVRTGREPHRDDGGRELRSRTGTRHPASSRRRSVSCRHRSYRCGNGCSSCRSSAYSTRRRARQLTEQLLRAIRANRAKVVVIDITGVPSMDSTVANHLVQTVEASRLMGANVIITGLSSEIAHTLVTIGVDLSKMNAVGDLQGGIEEAERLLGYEVDAVG